MARTSHQGESNRRTPAAGTYMPLLDGLRGIAVILVVMHNLSLLSDPQSLTASLLAAWLDRGWIGVQLFFALSGFLITGILLDTRQTAHPLKSFAIRRALRIFPLYYLTLLVFTLLVPVDRGGLDLVHEPHQWSLWVFLSNWTAPMHAGHSTLSHFWSLAVEEQFYLVWPWLMLHRTPRQAMVVSGCIAALALFSRFALLQWTHLPAEAAYQFSVCRMDALALGSMAAAWLRWRDVRPQISGSTMAFWALMMFLGGALATAGYGIYGLMRQTVGYSALSISAALLVLACRTPQPQAAWQRPLCSRWLRSCGKYSYAMYVLHLPLHLAIGLPLLHSLHLDNRHTIWPTLPYVILGTLISWSVGAVSYRFLERPFLRLKDKLAPSAQALAA